MLTLVRMILFKILFICGYFYLLVAEYPWQAAILQKDEFDNIYTCGATLIDSSHLLTASHCVNKFRLNFTNPHMIDFFTIDNIATGLKS